MKIKLQDLTFDIVQQVFADDYARQYSKWVSFPNADDSLTNILNADGLENWKEGKLRVYGNIELELNPDAKEWYNKVKVLDQKFMDAKNRYIDAKASYLDSERASGRSYGLDEIAIKRWDKLAGLSK